MIITAIVAACLAGQAGGAMQQGLYEEDVAASNGIRAAQARELEHYVDGLTSDRAPLAAIFRPAFSSPSAYTASTRQLRRALADSLGYPPPGRPDTESAEFRRVGEDKVATYYRFRIPVLPGVHSVGLYLVPKGLKGKAPLVIAMHGGGGSPEIALFHGGANYHDMIRGAVQRGYAVFAPTHLFSAEGEPPDLRQRLDSRARLAGTTITAIEIAKITRGLDVILKRPEVDSRRVAMIGLSYGGFYTLYTTALEPRIKVAVASCWFGDRPAMLRSAEPTGASDWRFTNGGTLFRDPEIVALICPRPLEIQNGDADTLIPIEAARRTAPLAAEYYAHLALPDRFRFTEFHGPHEFHGESAWDWLAKHL